MPSSQGGPALLERTQRWMQSVIRCTHYVAGAGERQYLNEADAPGVMFVARDEISDPNHAYIGE